MLSEKKITFETVEIDLKNKPDWFLKISPYGKVPVLHDGEEIYYESAIINEYLDDAYPQTPMLGNTPAERARMRIWIDFCNSKIQPSVSNVLKAKPEDFEAKTKALEDALEMLERYLQDSGFKGPFFGGAQFTLVDATYAPSFERFAVLPVLRGYQVPARFAHVTAWTAALAAHPAVIENAVPLDDLVANYRSFLPEGVSQVA